MQLTPLPPPPQKKIQNCNCISSTAPKLLKNSSCILKQMQENGQVQLQLQNKNCPKKAKFVTAHRGGGQKKTINTKNINIFLTALAGPSSQGQTGTHPRDKRDKMAVLLCNYAENGRFVPGTGPGLSLERVPFVPEVSYFSVFFSYFRGANPGWGILYFFENFFGFPGFRGFWALHQPRQDRKFIGFSCPDMARIVSR